MDAPATGKRLALDANVPLDLAAGLDFAHDFRETFQARGYALLLAPTAAEEIWLIHRDSSYPQQRQATRVARTIGRRFASSLIAAGHLPPAEMNDGIILAETALAEIPMLVTSDKHLLGIDENALLLAFNESDLPPVHPVHPKSLLRALR